MSGHFRTALRAASVAAAMVLGGAVVGTTAAKAAPLAPAPVEALAGETAATAVHWRHHHHWGHRHHHWGHHHRGWGPRHHRWGPRHYHHHHHHWRRHHFY